MTPKHTAVLVAFFVLCLTPMPSAASAGPPDLLNGGDPHESLGQADVKALSRGVTYTPSTFALRVRFRPPDGAWEGVQLQSGPFRFVQLLHRRTGTVPVHGRGYITLEASTHATSSVAKTIARLHATPNMRVSAIKGVQIAGFRGLAFNASITGTDPGSTGISLTPFTTAHHCGYCEVTLNHEGLDNRFAGKGQLLRIMAIDVRGKTVMVFLESDFPQPGYPAEKTFPTFVPYAAQLLATLQFP